MHAFKQILAVILVLSINWSVLVGSVGVIPLCIHDHHLDWLQGVGVDNDHRCVDSDAYDRVVSVSSDDSVLSVRADCEACFDIDLRAETLPALASSGWFKLKKLSPTVLDTVAPDRFIAKRERYRIYPTQPWQISCWSQRLADLVIEHTVMII